MGWIAQRRAARLTPDWLVRSWNARRPDLEDSSELLFADPAALAALPRLQRERLRGRLDATPPPDLRPRWPDRTLALAWALGLATAVALVLWPHRQASDTLAPAGTRRPPPPVHPGWSASGFASCHPPIPACHRAIWTGWTRRCRRGRASYGHWPLPRTRHRVAGRARRWVRPAGKSGRELARVDAARDLDPLSHRPHVPAPPPD
ncbi:hypothetical protein P0F65_14010 [Sphingomonas sp. I4]